MENPSDLQQSQAPSLLLRLAGPSATKAGLSTEQTEINRIIAEVSKGSKFYENEKRKDEEVTERIQYILKLRDQAVKGVDMGKVEQKVDRLLEAIERERDVTQYIVHFDMDAFYANVELLENPSLAGKPFGVGHGVLTTASYEARKFGVRSGMPGHIALKLCPELILVNLHMSLYSEVSKRIMAIFRQYDPNMLAASVDEAYLNITEYCKQHNLGPDECVQLMRQRVFDETKLTVSAGIAANKVRLRFLCLTRYVNPVSLFTRCWPR
jgi:DNA polymerase kappa